MSEGKKLVNQILENKFQIEVKNTQRKNLEESRKNEIWQLRYKVYGPQIDALQSRLNSEVSKLEETSKQEQEQKYAEIKQLYEPYHKAQRIIKFLHLKDTDEKRHPQNFPAQVINPEYVIVRRGGFKEDLGFLIKEDYLNIRLLIVSNDKPSNCYSLIAMGNTVFYDSFDYPLLNIPRSNKPEQWQNAAYYSSGPYAIGNARIDITIKTGKTPEELKQWLERNREKIFAEFLKDYQAVKAEYEQVLKTYSLEDFKELPKEEY